MVFFGNSIEKICFIIITRDKLSKSIVTCDVANECRQPNLNCRKGN